MARAIWKAELHLGPVRVPVKLYSAAVDRKVRFRLLHERDLAPVRQVMIDPVDERRVAKEEIQKGVEIEEGVFVILSDEERERLAPPPSREIVIEQIVPPTQLDARLLDTPYYLGPDGSQADYFALADALTEQGKLGIAHWVMRNNRYRGALFAKDGYLVLQTLRNADNLIAADIEPPSASRAPSKQELALAEQLVATLEDELDPSAFRDQYRDRLMDLIEAKAKGKVVQFPKRPRKRQPDQLTDALEASLKTARRASGGG